MIKPLLRLFTFVVWGIFVVWVQKPMKQDHKKRKNALI